MKETIDNLAKKSKAANPKVKNDYVNKKDGLLYCGKCRTPKEKKVTFPWGTVTVGIPCRHRDEEMEAIRKAEEAIERAKRIRENRFAAFPSEYMHSMTFENDITTNEKLKNALKKYAELFPEYREKGLGLLLYGSLGTGKTFAAAEVANKLIDEGYTAKFTSFADIKSELIGTRYKEDVYESLRSCHLLVIDDFGIESDTKFTEEVVYTVINDRYKLNRPMVITTNLTIEEMMRPSSLSNGRVFDRILERCHPIKLDGNTKRLPLARKNNAEMKKALGV